MEKYIRWIVRNRKSMIVVLLLVTAVFCSQLRNLNVVLDPTTTLPQNHPFIAVSNRIEELFGHDKLMVVAITPKTGDAYQVPILGKLKRITDAIYKLPGVVPHSVLSLSSKRAKNISGENGALNVKPLMESVPSTAEGLGDLVKSVRSNPIYSNLIVSKDERTLFVLASFKKESSGYKVIWDRVESAVAPERDDTVRIDVGGEPVLVGLAEKLSARMGFLFPIAILIIGLIHYEAFRTVQALVLPLVTALLAVIWSLGIIGILNVPLDVFNVTTPILILAIAAGHAVQILKRYYEEFSSIRASRPGQDPVDASHLAVVRSIQKVGPVTIAAGTIAAASFLSLTVFEIKAIRVFGIFTAAGILSTLVLEVAFIPAIRSMLRPPGKLETERERQETFWDRIIRFASDLCIRRRKTVFLASASMIGLFLAGASMVRIDGSTKSNFFESLPELRADRYLNSQIGGTNVLYGLVEGKSEDAMKDPEILAKIEEIQKTLEKEKFVGKTLSIADFVKRINYSMHDNDPRFDRIPDDRKLIGQYLFLYSSSGDPEDFDNYVDYNYQDASIMALLKTNAHAYISGLIDRLNRQASGLFGRSIRFRAGGSAAESAALSEVIVRDKLINIVQIGACVMLIASLLFRSLSAGALILVPLAMTVLANFAAMGFFGIPLQLGTAIISAMAVGIGADYAIYLSYRLKEELGRRESEEEAVKKAFDSAGKTILFVSSAVAGGYSVLMLSYGFWVHIWIGFLIGLAMIVSSVTTLTIFPALILAFRPKFIFARRRG